MITAIIIAANLLITTTVLVILLVRVRRNETEAIAAALAPLASQLTETRNSLEGKIQGSAIEQAKELVEVRQAVADRLNANSNDIKAELDHNLAEGRREQAESLRATTQGLESRFDALVMRLETKFENLQRATHQTLAEASEQLSRSQAAARSELAESLRSSGETLKAEMANLAGEVQSGLDRIRGEVASKLDQNIREGFQQFEKVQQHLQAAQDELRNVSLLGNSVNELNSLLKLPHLRGRFGEASLERLLADFLPAHMYELQAAAGSNGSGRADAVIKFPERVLPIDAKFPREQVLPLFETSDPSELGAARENFARVTKEQARRIVTYIHPENGTTDMALMFLPSETLYMETVLNGDLSEWLNKQKVYPVSPNTLIVTLQAIQMVFKMYEFAKGYERATEELTKAQKSFRLFEDRFDDIGVSLGNAQDSFDKAQKHLRAYRSRLTRLTDDDENPELPGINR
ncbi:MAG TPA: DNA recombination protein RmuC [Candidatus Binataceae bacterium]|nr:DNA recombination protein RmuC [Candidatus Binataceae bacterium]